MLVRRTSSPTCEGAVAVGAVRLKGGGQDSWIATTQRSDSSNLLQLKAAKPHVTLLPPIWAEPNKGNLHHPTALFPSAAAAGAAGPLARRSDPARVRAGSLSPLLIPVWSATTRLHHAPVERVEPRVVAHVDSAGQDWRSCLALPLLTVSFFLLAPTSNTELTPTPDPRALGGH